MVVLILLLCLVSTAFISYGSQTPELWKNGYSVEIFEPSLWDLGDMADQYKIIQYEEKIVKKYNRYISLKKEIEKFDKSSMDGLADLYVLVADFFVVYKAIMYSFVDLARFWVVVISIGITLLITFLSLFCVYKIFPVSTFDVAEQIDQYKSIDSYSEWPITQRADMNNFLVSRHEWFLICIHKTEQTRYVIRIIGYIIAAIAFMIALNLVV